MKQVAMNPSIKVFAACSPTFPLAPSMASEIQIEKWVPPQVSGLSFLGTVDLTSKWRKIFFKVLLLWELNI